MQRVIGGRLYDTATASRICSIPSYSDDPSNFRWNKTALYKSPCGTYFIAGHGRRMSRWADERAGRRYGGPGIRILTELEARELAELVNLKPQAYEAAFGAPEVG